MLEQMDNIQIIQEMNIHAFSHCTLRILSHARANSIQWVIRSYDRPY